LISTPGGRFVLALLDLYNRAEDLQYHADERLKVIQEQSVELEHLRLAARKQSDLKITRKIKSWLRSVTEKWQSQMEKIRKNNSL